MKKFFYILIFSIFFPSIVFAARTDGYWNNLGDFLNTNLLNGYSILLNGLNKYINFNLLPGASGYGFRDNSGTIEVKNNGGSWSSILGLGSDGGDAYDVLVTNSEGNTEWSHDLGSASNRLGTIYTDYLRTQWLETSQSEFDGSFKIGSSTIAVPVNLVFENNFGTSNFSYGNTGTLNYSSASTTNSLSILNNGYVGIGTTTPVGLLSAGPMHVFNNGGSCGSNTRVIIGTPGVNVGGDQCAPFAINQPDPNGFYYGRIGSTNAALEFGMTNGLAAGYFNTKGAIPLAFWINTTERMRLDAAGNLGIGTTNPTQKLTVVGNIDSSAEVRALYGKFNRISNRQTGNYLISFDGSDNVGIGTTNPGVSLDVIGDIRTSTRIQLTSQAYISPGRYYSGTNDITFGAWNSADVTRLQIKAISGDTYLVPNGGNVGIGTTNPGTKLYIDDGAGTGWSATVASNNPSFGFYDKDNSFYGAMTTNAGEMLFQKWSSPTTWVANPVKFNLSAPDGSLVLTSTGNVGIGTTTPSEKLQIIGNILSSGYIEGKKSGVYAYLNTASSTTITTANTYYAINGTFNNSPFENFSAGTVYSPSIKYDGTKTQYFKINWNATISGNNPSMVVHCGVKKNGTLLTGSVMGTLLKTAGEEYNLSGTIVTSLNQNDEIQLVATSDSDGDILTFEHYTTTINEFFD